MCDEIPSNENVAAEIVEELPGPTGSDSADEGASPAVPSSREMDERAKESYYSLQNRTRDGNS